jgi:hypothetical protein
LTFNNMHNAEVVMSDLLQPSPAGTGFSLAVGPRHFPAWALVSLCPFLAAGGRVSWVDAANSFDLFGLSRAAQARGADPRAVLDRVELIRPFTAFQLEKIAARPPRGGTPLVLSDPMSLFYDEDLPQDDALRLFDRFLGHVSGFRTPAVVLAVRRTPAPARASFASRLRSRAGAVAVLSHGEGAWRLESLRRGEERIA